MNLPAASMRRSRRKGAEARPAIRPHASDQPYRVGPGRPPPEFQFKPGQSGNPRGAKRKPASIIPDLKALLEEALGGKVTLRQGDKERIVTKAAAGIEQMVNQFAQGDRNARRDLIDLAYKLGVDLTADRGQAADNALETTVTADDEALLADYVKRHSGESVSREHDTDDPAAEPNTTELSEPTRPDRRTR
jgi:hypothetical protein